MEGDDKLHHAAIVYAIGTFSIAVVSVLFNLIFITSFNISAENQVSIKYGVTY